MCAHKETGCKGTKKNSYIQIYERKSAENLNFVRKIGGFEGYEALDWENYNDHLYISIQSDKSYCCLTKKYRKSDFLSEKLAYLPNISYFCIRFCTIRYNRLN